MHRAPPFRVRRAAALGSLGFVGVGVLLAAWAFWFEPRRLVIDSVTLDLPRWPEPLHGLRIALLADLHIGSPHWTLERLEGLVDETNQQEPDLVLLAGDYLINRVRFGTWVAPEPIARVLAGLHSAGGTIAVLGNHDWWNDGERVRRAFQAQGIVVLENEAHPVAYRGSRFFVVGLADALERHVDIEAGVAQVPAGEPFIVLVHEPDVFPDVDGRAALTLAGHTHGGQVRLPFIGSPIIPSRYGQRYAAGHVVEGGRHLFVTSGIGTSIIPVRFGVPPEVALLELR